MLAATARLPAGLYEIVWKFSAAHVGQKARQWKLTQEVDADGLQDVLINLGLAGQEVTDQTIVGAQCRLVIVTIAQQSWAKVKDTLPLAGDA